MFECRLYLLNSDTIDYLCTSLCKSTLSFNLITYCPSRGAGADPFALTDTSILAGAACLAFFGAGRLAAVKMIEAMA